MNRIARALALSSAVLLGGSAVAQPGRAVERANDRKEVKQDARAADDDRKDLAQVQTLTNRFDAARSRRDWRTLGQIDGEVAGLLAREQQEGRVEMAKAKAEVRQDQREVGRDGMHGATSVAKADDRRDARDDVRDAKAEAAANAQNAALAREWNGLKGRQDPKSLDRKRAILAQAQSNAIRELGRDQQEKTEDRREQREDHRH